MSGLLKRKRSVRLVHTGRGDRLSIIDAGSGVLVGFTSLADPTVLDDKGRPTGRCLDDEFVVVPPGSRDGFDRI